MKPIDRFFRRYILSVIGILLLFFVINIVLIGILFLTSYLNGVKDSVFPMERFSNLIEQKNGAFAVDPEANDILAQTDAWAMLIDDEGAVIWESGLPEGLPLKYSASEIAMFSRWYLKDYPVKIWNHPNGLLVVGFQPGTISQYYISFKIRYFWLVLFICLAALVINIGVMIFLFLRNTRKIETAMRPILAGIQKLSQGETFHLEEKGKLAEINTGLNHASDYLAKKDNTRAEWIRGISHDIRTPLSMILGYSSEIEDNPDLPAATRRQAEIIRKQSEKLRTLVADLNLTTKLEYSMQPFRIKPLDPLELIRQVISEFLNNGLPEGYELELSGTDTDIKTFLYGDNFLLNRMLHNLIQNSITHNPGGCQITVSVKMDNRICTFCVADSGCGIKESYLALLNNDTSIPSSQTETAEAEHGLGLKIVRQIVKVHYGDIQFSNITPHGLKTEIHLPDKFKG